MLCTLLQILVVTLVVVLCLGKDFVQCHLEQLVLVEFDAILFSNGLDVLIDSISEVLLSNVVIEGRVTLKAGVV